MEYPVDPKAVLITVPGGWSSSLEENIRSMELVEESNRWKYWFIMKSHLNSLIWAHSIVIMIEGKIYLIVLIPLKTRLHSLNSRKTWLYILS